MLACLSHTRLGVKMSQLLTDKEVADLFRVSRTTIWNWVRNSQTFPKPNKYNGATRWKAEDINAYINAGGDDE
jgi:predicted DNA-binding transcriptional regulator AlpA